MFSKFATKTHEMKILTNKRIVNQAILLLFGFTLFIILPSCNEVVDNSSDNLSKYKEVLKQKLNPRLLDSLYHKALLLPNNTTQVGIILRIYKKTIRNRPIRYDMLDTALYLAKAIDYSKGIASAYDKKGMNSRYQIKYRESANYHKQALNYWDKTTDTIGKIKSLNSLGVSLRRLNNEKEAMNYYLEALKLSRVINHTKSIAVALNGIGNVFVNINQYDKALPYFKEALEMEKKLNNKKGINYDLSNIGEVYVYISEYDSAKLYYHKALEIAKELDYKDNISINYNCLGYLYQQKGDLSKSNEYYSLAIPKLEEYNGKRYLSNTLINLGSNYTELQLYKQALPYINNGLNLAIEINSPENIILGYTTLSKYYNFTSDYNLAFINYKKSITLRDSIQSQESKQNIAALEAVYENEIKDKRIKNLQYQANLQKNQNILQLIIIVFLLFLVSGLFIFYRLKRKNNLLVVDRMRNDIQEYIHRIENFENKQNQKDETDTFNKNIDHFGLTERETDVLLLISQGLRNEEIANKLFISVSTIKTHTRNIFVKLDVRNRIEAVRKTQSV